MDEPAFVRGCKKASAQDNDEQETLLLVDCLYTVSAADSAMLWICLLGLRARHDSDHLMSSRLPLYPALRQFDEASVAYIVG